MKLTNEQIKKGLRISIAEGAFAHMYANLTGSIFLPAFALLLMASDFVIGLLASIPFFAAITQIFGSLIVEKYQKRKKITLISAFISRLIWLPILILALLLFDGHRDLLLLLVILLIVIHHMFGSVSGVAWLSWMSNLVPPVIRGRFFGLRNSFLGIVTLVTVFIGGIFLDWWDNYFEGAMPNGSFIILFGLAVIAGISSLALLTRQPDIEQPVPTQLNFKTIFSDPFKNNSFKRIVRFAMFWSFAVNFASPFYVIYMIRDLAMSYTLISLVTILSALADLFGMGFWGNFSDRHGNRPVVIISATMGSLLPFLWVFTGSSDLAVLLFIPLLHLAGGFFFAGYNLCSINLLFGLVPRQNNSMYFALWSVVNGVAAGIGAIIGGIFAHNLQSLPGGLPFGWESVFKMVFLFSAAMRFMSVFFLRRVEDSKGVSLSGAVRILRSVRTWTTTMGYHPLLQFFLPSRTEKNNNGDEEGIWPFWETKEPPEPGYQAGKDS